MESTKSFEARFSRIMQAASVSKDAELAKILGIKQSSVVAARKRQQIPTGWIEHIAEKFRVNANWLFFGEGVVRDNKTQSPPHELPVVPQFADSCERCARLEKRLEALEEERWALTAENRQLNLENRQLWKENGDLRERCARLEGQGALDACLPFKKLPNTQSSDRANS